MSMFNDKDFAQKCFLQKEIWTSSIGADKCSALKYQKCYKE